MQATHARDRSQKRQEYLPQQRILYRLLPIVGAAIVMGVIEGWPPTAWIYLFHVYTQWNTLWSQQQTALLLPVGVLALQSILLLVAWVLCLWLAGRELIYLAGFNRQQVSTRPMAIPQQGNFANAQQVAASLPVRPQQHVQPVFPVPQSQQTVQPVNSGTWIPQTGQSPIYPGMQPQQQPSQAVPPTVFVRAQPQPSQAVPPTVFTAPPQSPPMVPPAQTAQPGEPYQNRPASPLPDAQKPLMPVNIISTPPRESRSEADQSLSNPFEEVEEGLEVAAPFQVTATSQQEIDNPFLALEEEQPVQFAGGSETQTPVADEDLTQEETSQVSEEELEEESGETPVEELEETGKQPRDTGDALKKKPFQPGNAQQQSEVLRDLGFYEAAPSADASQEKSLSVLGEAALEMAMKQPMEMETISPTRAPQSTANNPFDVQSDLIELFQEQSTIEEKSEDELDLSNIGEESIYVFGNPFEGPLPDVFHHDDALKKVLLENKKPPEEKKK